MKLYRVTILKKSEPLAVPDENYVGADDAQAALAVVFGSLNPGQQTKVVSWNVDQISTTLLIAP